MILDCASTGPCDPDPSPAALAGIRSTPLHQIRSAQVDAVVRRVLNEERGELVVDVAMFNSAI